MQKTYKYQAFISYSHNDKNFAEWLHKRIENYKIPKDLREKYPHLPKKLKRSIFRDEEELSTSSLLGEKLKDALNNSKKLIVICSPSAVNSKWVNEEIRYFKEIHGDSSLLAIIKEGEPNASNSSFYDSNLEAFPQSLRYRVGEDGKLTEEKREYVAGDARKGSNKEMALVKLLAGILEVDFADLWKREKRERLKRNAIKIFFTLFLFGVFWFAYTTYETNQVIEGHGIEFVQLAEKKEKLKLELTKVTTDDEKIALWNKIEKANKQLKIIEEVEKNIASIEGEITKKGVNIYKKSGAKKSLQFMNSEEVVKREEKSIKLLSERWIFKANMNIIENQYSKAKEFYEKAIAIDFSFQNVVDYGLFLYKQNSYKRAIEIYEKLVKQQLSDKQKSIILNNLANLYRVENKPDKAQKIYSEALRLKRILVKKNPHIYNASLANTLNNFGLLYFNTKKFDKAQKALNESLLLRRALVKENSSLYTHQVAESLHNLANLYSTRHQFNEAIKGYTESLMLFRILAKSDPSKYRSYVAGTLNNLAEVHNKRSENIKAKEEFTEALTLYRILVKQNPNAYSYSMAMTLNNLATLYPFNKSKEANHEALQIIRVLAKNNSNAYSGDMAMSLHNLACLYRDNNKFAKAKKLYIQALELYEALAKKNPRAYNFYLAGTWKNLALLYSRTNQFEEAEKSYKKALILRVALAKKNPRAYSPDVAITLHHVANLYRDNNKLDRAQKIYNKVVQLYTSFSKDNPTLYNPYLANTLGDLSMLYTIKEELEKAKKSSLQALELYKTLAKSNPNGYNSDIDKVLSSLIPIYHATKEWDKLEKVYLEELELRKYLLKDNPIYKLYVADTLSNLAILYYDTNRFDKLKKAYQEALALRRVLAKENPNAYNLDLARTIIKGVSLMELKIDNLDEAQEILENFQDNIEAQKLLQIIMSIKSQSILK